mmetsp:Transcript_98853/g.227089  ORF Transcript_98853/g.227089 Transcript_98853/m.227089 type:complete len:200 (+) Transcript_98853:25-624(+)
MYDLRILTNPYNRSAGDLRARDCYASVAQDPFYTYGKQGGAVHFQKSFDTTKYPVLANRQRRKAGPRPAPVSRLTATRDERLAKSTSALPKAIPTAPLELRNVPPSPAGSRRSQSAVGFRTPGSAKPKSPGDFRVRPPSTSSKIVEPEETLNDFDPEAAVFQKRLEHRLVENGIDTPITYQPGRGPYDYTVPRPYVTGC